MRHSRYILMSILLVTVAALAGCRAAPPAAVVEPASQDLGKRPQELLELNYTVRNTGSSPLTISRISTSCDCTKAAMDRTEIPAGESAQLRVTLDPVEDNLYGNILRVVYLSTNDPKRPEIEAEFRVTIQKPEG